MEKELLLLPKKIIVFIIFIFSLTYNSTFAQCTNPTPTGDTSQEFCKTADRTVNDLVASGGTIVWYDASSGGELLNLEDLLINGTTYYADDISGGSCSTSRLAVTVTIYGDYPTNVDVLVGKCAIDNPTIDDLSATGQNLAWYDTQTGGNLLPLSTLLVNGQTYWVQQTENGCTSNRLPTTVTLIDPPTPTTDSIQSFCYPPIATVGDLKPSGTSVIWYESETSLTPLKTNTPLIDGADYWVAEVSFPCVSSKRAQTTVVLDAAPNAGISDILLVCEVDLVTTNLFDLLGGTPDTTGTWTGPSVLTGGYLGTFEPGTNVEGTYTYSVSSILGICPDDSANITVTITVVPPPTITETTQSFCIVDLANSPTLADLTVDTIGAGNVVRWYADATSTVELPLTTTLVNNTTYFASQFDTTSNCESALRDSKTALIEIAPNAGTDGSYTDCEIDLVDTDLFTLLGGSPDVSGTWTAPDGSAHSGTFVAGTDVAGVYTYTVAGGTICPDDTAIVTVAITVIPAPIITDANQSFCIADLASSPTLADLTVDTIGAGNVVRWYADATSTVELPSTTTLVNNTTYFASQFDSTSNCESALRDSKTALIEIAPNAGTDGSYSDCEIDLVDTNLFTLLGGSPDVSGTWTAPNGSAHSGTFVAGTDVAGIYTYTVAGGTICPDDTAIVMVAITLIPAPIITDANQSFCIVDLASSPTLADLTVDTIGAGNVVRWYADATSTVELPLTTTLVNNTTYFASQFDTTSNCESALRDSKTALIEIAPNAGTDGSYSDCEIDLVDTNLFSLLGGSPDVSGTWTAPDGSAHSGTFVAGTDVAGVYTYSVGGPICTPDTAIVTVTITVVSAPSITNNNPSFCIVDTKTVGDLVVDDATATITWYDAAISGNVIDPTTVLTTSSLWASQTNSSGCESVNRNVVNVTIIDLQTPITSANQSFCLAFKPTIASLVADGQNVLWFENETDDVTLALDSTTELEDNKTYWAADVDLVNGCESLSRASTLVALTDAAPATIANISQTFCESDFPTISNLAATGNGIVWYATETSTAPLANTSLLMNGTAYWAVQTNTTTGCESSLRVVVNVALTSIATPTLISLGNEFCKIDNPTIADLNMNVSANNGGAISWYDAFPNGNLLNTSAALTEGETYYAIETDVNGCKSINPLEVTVTLEACDQYDVVIYDGFSPSGNGVNDTFKITNLRELYPNFKVEFFNRWGNLIYTASAAKDDWNGRLNGDGELSAAGVYYFVIYFNKNDRKPIQRRLYLSR